jgi:hypothetical protein
MIAAGIWPTQVAGHPLGLLNPTLYALRPGTPRHRRRDLGQQHDLVTGMGTVNALYLVYELADRRRTGSASP